VHMSGFTLFVWQWQASHQTEGNVFVASYLAANTMILGSCVYRGDVCSQCWCCWALSKVSRQVTGAAVVDDRVFTHSHPFGPAAQLPQFACLRVGRRGNIINAS
jgi:hypothetical protein